MSDIDRLLDIASLVCLALAAILSAAAGVGLLRFTDSLSRLHAATKPQIFGLLLVIAGVALDQRSWGVLLALVPVFVFQSLTAPAAAHMVGRAAYRSKHLKAHTLVADDLADVVRGAEAMEAQDRRRYDA